MQHRRGRRRRWRLTDVAWGRRRRDCTTAGAGTGRPGSQTLGIARPMTNLQAAHAPRGPFPLAEALDARPRRRGHHARAPDGLRTRGAVLLVALELDPELHGDAIGVFNTAAVEALQGQRGALHVLEAHERCASRPLAPALRRRQDPKIQDVAELAEHAVEEVLCVLVRKPGHMEVVRSVRGQLVACNLPDSHRLRSHLGRQHPRFFGNPRCLLDVTHRHQRRPAALVGEALQ
mmetsp:Transcript_172229/g.552127  ORF Transcript_172229/g.552127 Transcript_172229/m.552127 type:complete len:233 (+) Transcript_172229:1673-2371(+)